MDKSMIERIEQVLDERVRPLLKRHYGNIEVAGIEDGILHVMLLGKCSACPAAILTHEQLIKTELIDAIPQIKQVVLDNGVSHELLQEARSMLSKK